MTTRAARTIARRIARELFTDKNGKRIVRFVIDFEYWRLEGTAYTEPYVAAQIAKALTKKKGSTRGKGL